MSRTKARKSLTLDNFQADMAGIKANVSDQTMDECPRAYKDFSTVMEAQKDLVTITHKLKPILNVKG
jgi:tRNA-splicing ligase RtcB (3'-phosphate/5'-hydroxy nucleic acid ligase)